MGTPSRTVIRCLFSLICAFPVIGSATQSAAQIGLTGGTEYGFGGVGRFGTPEVLIEVGGGIAPVLVAGFEQFQINGNVVSEEFFFEAFFPAAVGGKLSLGLSNSDDGMSRTALEFGATYNSLLGLGFGGGFDAQTSKKMIVSGGLYYFPDASDRLGARVSVARNYPVSRLNLGPIVKFQPYVSIALLFF